MTFTAAIVGRPNVGKSTLFNRLVGKRLALVDDTPGVTRDRRPGKARLGDITFEVIDTAGLEDASETSLEGRMRGQTEAAILEADVTMFVIDARAGVTPLDSSFATALRRAGKPVILVANKVEGRRGDEGLYEAYGMGFGEPVPISAEHGEGMADLRDALVASVGEDVAYGLVESEPLDEDAEHGFDPDAFDMEAAQSDGEIEETYDPDRPLRIAIVGQPQCGQIHAHQHDGRRGAPADRP